MIKKFFSVLFFVLSVLSVFAQNRRTNKLIIVTFDGYRWKELFRGADSAFLFGRAFNTQDSAALIKKFWGSDITERRKKLMPFFWNTIAEQGQLYGNRDHDNNVNVKNRYWFSYPGYNEMFSGYPDTLINSNDYPPNPNTTVQEFINRQNKYKGKVAVFTSWDAHSRILNRERSGLIISSGYEDLSGITRDETQKLLDQQQYYFPKIFGSSERPDASTYVMAKNYLKKNHPMVLQLSLIDTDAFGHAGKYDFYLDAAHYNDAMIADLWATVQSDPFYKDQTTLFITVDHGRGDDDSWKHHGAKISHADEIWMAIMGPDAKPEGELKVAGQLYQNQVAKTLGLILGFDFENGHTIGEPVKNMLPGK